MRAKREMGDRCCARTCVGAFLLQSSADADAAPNSAPTARQSVEHSTHPPPRAHDHHTQQQPQILGLGAAFALSALLSAAPAQADVTADLLAKSAANKEINDKKRLATSGANLARSRTVADGTCAFPANFFGCEETSAKFTGGVRYIQDDVDLECAGNATGRCASRPNMNFGSKGF